MAYDKDTLFNQAKKEIQDRKIFFMEEVIDYLPCTKSTFYTYFPDKSDDLNALKELLSVNKTTIKQGLRNRWYLGENPTTQLALYKLLSTPEELRSLSMNTVDLKGDVAINWHEVRNYEERNAGNDIEDEENKE